jgi:hypothetical protein
MYRTMLGLGSSDPGSGVDIESLASNMQMWGGNHGSGPGARRLVGPHGPTATMPPVHRRLVGPHVTPAPGRINLAFSKLYYANYESCYAHMDDQANPDSICNTIASNLENTLLNGVRGCKAKADWFPVKGLIATAQFCQMQRLHAVWALTFT